jgi:hypothetical protein
LRRDYRQIQTTMYSPDAAQVLPKPEPAMRFQYCDLKALSLLLQLVEESELVE